MTVYTEEAIARGQRDIHWPNPLEEEAFYGLAGDVVRAIAPHTEADPARSCSVS
ncbi:hypothetical protein ACFLX5_03240 [Chloroflexota bacterium]